MTLSNLNYHFTALLVGQNAHLWRNSLIKKHNKDHSEAENDAKSEFTASECSRKFADRLRESIPPAMTQAEFAAEIGVSLSGLRRWLTGDSEPGISSLIKAARVANVSIEWLATGSEGEVSTHDGDGEASNHKTLDVEAIQKDLIHPDIVRLAVAHVSEYLQKRKVWADVRPDEISKMVMIIAKIVNDESGSDPKAHNFERLAEITGVIVEQLD